MESSAVQFVRRLLVRAPAFERVYREHLTEYDELLPHVLMGDFTRWFIALLQRQQTGGPASEADRTQLQAVASFLEEELASGDAAVRDLIGASFLENLWQAGEHYGAAKQVLGPLLRDWLSQME